MKWLRHRKTEADRAVGMVFAWRIPEGGIGRMIASVLVTALAAVLFMATVRVHVNSQPRQSHRRGAMMLEPSDGTGWFDRLCAESSPFPAPFDALAFDDAAGSLEKHPAWAMAQAESYLPRFRGLPEGRDFDRKRDIAAGHADLPPLAPLPPVPEPREKPKTARRVPVLRADSLDLAPRIPAPLPGFHPGTGNGPPPGEHRFLVELDPSGMVFSVVPMSPSGEAEAMQSIIQWLRSLRFEPGGDTRKWYVVTVTFVFPVKS